MNIEIVLRQSTSIKHSITSSVTNSYASAGLSSSMVGENNQEGKLVDSSHKLISKSTKFLMDYQLGEA